MRFVKIILENNVRMRRVSFHTIPKNLRYQNLSEIKGTLRYLQLPGIFELVQSNPFIL